MKGLWPLGAQSLSLNAFLPLIKDEDEMGNLCARLAAFHISMRMARTAENQSCPLTPEGGERQQLKVQMVVDERPFTRAAPVNNPPPACSGSLPAPNPGHRPIWEPPNFDYSWHEGLLAAEKVVTAENGRKDATWRSEVMVNQLEYNMLSVYLEWVQDTEVDTKTRFLEKYGGKKRRRGAWGHEVEFWSSLLAEVWTDRRMVGEEAESINTKYGKSREQSGAFISQATEIATKKDPTHKWRGDIGVIG